MRHEGDFWNFVFRMHAPIATVLEVMFSHSGHVIERQDDRMVVEPSNEAPSKHFVRHMYAMRGGESDSIHVLQAWCVAAVIIRALGPVDLIGLEDDFAPVEYLARQGAKVIGVPEAVWAQYAAAMTLYQERKGCEHPLTAQELEVPADPRRNSHAEPCPWLGKLHQNASQFVISEDGSLEPPPNVNDLIVSKAGSAAEISRIGLWMQLENNPTSWITAFENQAEGRDIAAVTGTRSKFRVQRTVAPGLAPRYSFRLLHQFGSSNMLDAQTWLN